MFGASSSYARREITIVDEETKKRRSMEQVRAHLARAEEVQYMAKASYTRRP